MHAVVIPFRGPASAKSRLAEGLSDAARRQVARAMFQHVLNVACATAGSRSVVVVTGSSTAAAIARRCGAVVRREAVAGHNEAVTEAFEYLRSRGATTAAVVSADLPLLKPFNLKCLEACARGGSIGIAPDRAGQGTNALTMPLGVSFKFDFGCGSFEKHLGHARRLGIRVRFVRQAGLASDVDTPDDLELLRDPAALSTLPIVGRNSYAGMIWSGASAAAALAREALL